MAIKKRVLISGVGGSLFPYLIHVLGKKYDLIMVDSNEVIKKIYPGQNILTVPPATDESYESVIERIIKQEDVEYYIPLIDEEIPRAHEIAARNPGLKLISPSVRFVNLCLDKYSLMKKLESSNISSVKTFLADDFNFEIDFPVFLKPRMSRGSRGIRKIKNDDQFKAYFMLEEAAKKDILIQEYLEGEEYTVSVVVNNLNKLISVVPKRILLKKGITQHALTERNNDIVAVCIDIVAKLGPAGPFNVQLMASRGRIKIFEINPRFSTTSVLTYEAGIKEFDLCIETYNKEGVKYIESFKEKLYLYRRWENSFYEN